MRNTTGKQGQPQDTARGCIGSMGACEQAESFLTAAPALTKGNGAGPFDMRAPCEASTSRGWRAVLAVAIIAAATLTSTLTAALACRRPALQGCSERMEPPSRSSVRGRALLLESTRESAWQIHQEESGYTRALCVRGNSCSESKSCQHNIARSPAPRAPRRSNHEARLDPRPSRLYRGPEDDRIPPRRACAKAGWRRYWVDLLRIRRFYANSTQQSAPQLTNGGRHMETGTNRAGPIEPPRPTPPKKPG